MGGGAIIPAVEDIAVGFSIFQNLSVSVAHGGEDLKSFADFQSGPWRPPQWSGPALTMLKAGSLRYVFDAVFLLSHRSSLTTTRNPVLTGANITDHAYLEPKQVILEIGMSDAMDQFEPKMWWGNSPSKSVNAYQTLLLMQEHRTLLSLTSRLNTISNMLVVDVSARDDVTTLHGLRATVVLQQIIMATASSTPFDPANSTRPQDIGQTQSGTVQPTPPTNAVTKQFQVPYAMQQGNTGTPSTGAQINTGTDVGSTVSGSGTYSSNPVSGLTK